MNKNTRENNLKYLMSKKLNTNDSLHKSRAFKYIRVVAVKIIKMTK